MEAGSGEAASAGSDDGVAVGRESGEQGAGSGEERESGDVGDLGLLDEFGFVRGVEVGRDQAHGLDGGAAVSDVDDVGGVEVVLVGPGRPDASAAGSGIDEDSVEIEEDGVDVVGGHVGSVAEGGVRGKGWLARADAPRENKIKAAQRRTWSCAPSRTTVDKIFPARGL